MGRFRGRYLAAAKAASRPRACRFTKRGEFCVPCALSAGMLDEYPDVVDVLNPFSEGRSTKKRSDPGRAVAATPDEWVIQLLLAGEVRCGDQ